MRYDPRGSMFYGMTTAQLQAALANAVQAKTDLMLGNKPVTVSYTQGSGSKSVQFSPTSMANLNVMIAELKTLLGVICHPRRPISFVYRP